ncbi:hypothetical protein K1T71_008450 [Dendrolimus kikuchii]|uniref:Uncharacterized protein n=1 Tax=Dendrolimus kikuchii TaxID=765133 RepID=A0ACC1CXF8_9NEOP|nr:hypothetical protein K1T71_008450 [Dendrolimus kikuchii]
MAIELPRFEKCCFCVPLRLACLLIGYISIIAACLTIAASIFYVYRIANFVKESKEHPNPQHLPEEVAQISLVLYTVFGYYILVFLYSFIINLLLVVGIHANKVNLLKIYFRATLVLFALSIVLVVVTSVFMGFIATVPILKWCFILLVCLVVVRSTYLDMEERNKPKSFEMQNLYISQQAPLNL